MDKSKRPLLKKKRSFRRRLSPIQPGDRIDYRKTRLLNRCTTKEGKILPRRTTRLTFKQHRLVTIAIKQARILSLLPFVNNEQNARKMRAIARAKGLSKKKDRRTRKKGRTKNKYRTGNQDRSSNQDLRTRKK